MEILLDIVVWQLPTRGQRCSGSLTENIWYLGLWRSHRSNRRFTRIHTTKYRNSEHEEEWKRSVGQILFHIFMVCLSQCYTCFLFPWMASACRLMVDALVHASTLTSAGTEEGKLRAIVLWALVFVVFVSNFFWFFCEVLEMFFFLVVADCNQTITNNITYLVSPSFPSAMANENVTSCGVHIKVLSEEISQLRIDFYHFSLVSFVFCFCFFLLRA